MVREVRGATSFDPPLSLTPGTPDLGGSTSYPKRADDSRRSYDDVGPAAGHLDLTPSHISHVQFCPAFGCPLGLARHSLGPPPPIVHGRPSPQATRTDPFRNLPLWSGNPNLAHKFSLFGY